LHKFGIWPRLSEGAHVLQVARRKTLHVQKGIAQVLRQPFDDLGAPAYAALPIEDVAADLPVQQHQFAVDRQRRPLLGGVDAGLQLGEPSGVIGGKREDVEHEVQRSVKTAQVCRPRAANSPMAGCSTSWSSVSAWGLISLRSSVHQRSIKDKLLIKSRR